MERSRPTKDNDLEKGAVEEATPRSPGQTSLTGQLDHRSQDPMIKDNDSDFPEPGSNPEHSGEIGDPKDPEADNPRKAPGAPNPQNPDDNPRDDPQRQRPPDPFDDKKAPRR